MADKEHDDFRAEFRSELNSRWTTEQLRELIESVNRERDRRYMDRFKALEAKVDAGFVAAKEAVANALTAAKEAVANALVAAKELVANSFESSKQAIAKAEMATEKRFESVNEFRSQLKDQQVTLIPRSEAEQRFTQLRELFEVQAKQHRADYDHVLQQIGDVQRVQSRGEGGEDVRQKIRQMTMWIIGLMVMAGLSILGLIAALIYFLAGKH